MFFARKKRRPARTNYSAIAKAARFLPSLERLETRDVPATASLAAGVLTVNGTTGNDSIVLRQANGRVSIGGITATFASTNVNSVVVNAGTGNDAVSLVGLKAQPWNKPVTVNSAGGNDTVKLLDGRTAYVSGLSQRVAASSTGAVTVNGRALDWFDTNIHDAALRQLLRTDAADGAVNRTEELGVFQKAEQDGVINSNEFADLRTMAYNGWLFGSSSYLVDLTHNVALGNSANAHYQGTALGNLTAGAAGSKLDKLVHKWFLGADHPAASYSGLTVTYTTAAGSLFGGSGPQYTDVHQGAVGDCYFVATLGEVALRDSAAIQNMFIVNGDGTYGVRFYQSGISHYVTVDSKLPTYTSGGTGGWFLYANMGSNAANSSNVLWVALAEKAYAQMNETNWLRPAAWGGGVNSYAGIEGGMFSDAVAQVVNHASSSYYVSGASDDTALGNAVANGKLVGFASSSNPTNSQVVGDHQYIVIAYNSSTKTVTLFNPWGINNGSSYPGLVDLTLSQLAGNFDYWTVA